MPFVSSFAELEMRLFAPEPGRAPARAAAFACATVLVQERQTGATKIPVPPAWTKVGLARIVARSGTPSRPARYETLGEALARQAA
jgi:hypothetical protein